MNLEGKVKREREKRMMLMKMITVKKKIKERHLENLTILLQLIPRQVLGFERKGREAAREVERTMWENSVNLVESLQSLHPA